ncbi:MAG TPA: nitroreductase family deazaflavin-dependent oxidoreductase [Candidatus Limnocylindria bacterium]
MTGNDILGRHAADAVCHLATIGRRSGRSRVIEIWFATDGERVYFLAGGRDHAHWVRNIQADDRVRLRMGGTTLPGRARVVTDARDDLRARQLVAAKYQGWTPGATFSAWAAESLPVVVELGEAD